jgi:hypothetical protein
MVFDTFVRKHKWSRLNAEFLAFEQWMVGCQIIPLSVPLKNSFVCHSTENAFSDSTER